MRNYAFDIYLVSCGRGTHAATDWVPVAPH